MSRLAPLPGSMFPEVLLTIQRDALLPDWDVRLAAAEDVVGLHALIGNMPNAVEVQEAFLHALGEW